MSVCKHPQKAHWQMQFDEHEHLVIDPMVAQQS
jgi:hypothetical protein